MNHRVCPKGYRQIAVLDFVRNRRQMRIVAFSSLALTALMLAAGLILHPFGESWAFMKANGWTWPLLVALYLAYIPLHELTHGLLMHALSGQRPKYGLSLCYAYAGSTAYFDKFSHNLIALAPLVLWGIVLAALERILPSQWFWLIYILQITNVSGSAGDLYCVLHLLRMPENILIQDTGTRMRIFAPRPLGEEKS